MSSSSSSSRSSHSGDNSKTSSKNNEVKKNKKKKHHKQKYKSPKKKRAKSKKVQKKLIRNLSTLSEKDRKETTIQLKPIQKPAPQTEMKKPSAYDYITQEPSPRDSHSFVNNRRYATESADERQRLNTLAQKTIIDLERVNNHKHDRNSGVVSTKQTP